MGEILFKAKRKNWRELPEEEWWIEGYPVKYQPCASKNEYVYGIAPTYASALYIIEIDPETLCQYIRKNDKNGSRIWENDIVYIRSSGLSGYGTIGYKNGCLIVKDGKRRRTYSLFGEWTLRVDGNIFDNPELLEQDGE